MSIRLGPTWRHVLMRAWSIRLLAMSFVFDVAGILLEVMGASGAPRPVWAVLLHVAGAAFGLAAFVARLTYQHNMQGSEPCKQA